MPRTSLRMPSPESELFDVGACLRLPPVLLLFQAPMQRMKGSEVSEIRSRKVYVWGGILGPVVEED
jgi:hypothetical protein